MDFIEAGVLLMCKLPSASPETNLVYEVGALNSKVK